MSGAHLSAGVLDEDAAHGLGGGGEEVAAAVPLLGLFRVHQAQVGFVDEGGCLQGLAGLFLGQALGGQLAQLVVHEGQELLRGVGIALLDGGQDAGHFVHRAHQEDQESQPKVLAPLAGARHLRPPGCV